MAAPRANWKGYLRLSLVSCPVAVYPPPGRARKSASTSSTGIPAIGSNISRPREQKRTRERRHEVLGSAARSEDDVGVGPRMMGENERGRPSRD